MFSAHFENFGLSKQSFYLQLFVNSLPSVQHSEHLPPSTNAVIVSGQSVNAAGAEN